MYNSEGQRNRMDRSDRNNRSFAVAAGLALGFLGVYVTSVLPMKRQMETMQQEMASVNIRMAELVSAKSDVWQTSDLLTSLRSQQRQIEEARTSLSTIRQFRSDVTREVARTDEALGSLELLGALQDTLISQSDLSGRAADALDEMAALQERMILEQTSADDMRNAVNELVAIKQLLIAESADTDLAESALRQLANLKFEMIGEVGGIADARSALGDFIDLKDSILEESADLESAQLSADHLFDLKDELVIRGGNTHAARSNARRLMGIRDALAEADGTESAQANLSMLLSMKDNLSGRTSEVAAAIETLEILTDFHGELVAQVDSLQGIRRDLMEIALLESTVGRAVRIIQPLVQLGNIRRLNEDDVREAARTILERRTASATTRISRGTRRSGRPAVGNVDLYEGSNESMNEGLVPWPLEAE